MGLGTGRFPEDGALQDADSVWVAAACRPAGVDRQERRWRYTSGFQKSHGRVKDSTSNGARIAYPPRCDLAESGMDGTLTRASLVEEKYTFYDLPGLQCDDTSPSGRMEDDGALLR